MSINYKAIAGLLLLIALVAFSGRQANLSGEGTLMAQSEVAAQPLRVLGPIATVGEAETEMQFLARVDTGARTCSIHAAEKQVTGGSKYMEENLGKIVRFRVSNRQGDSQWIERPIAEVRKIRTSEGEETRYLVAMTLQCNEVEREVLVSLNDRSQMTYNMLLGRNFLENRFVVDVTGADDIQELLLSKR